MILKVTVKTEEAKKKLTQVANDLTLAKLNQIFEKVAYQTLADVVESSPKRWFGQIQKGWRVQHVAVGTWAVNIPDDRRTVDGKKSVNDILNFVENGTGNDGTEFIYPVRAKRLFIPLTRSAAGGWHEGLTYGKDYILVLRVRGIKASHFVRRAKGRATRRGKKAIADYLIKVTNQK